MGPNRGAVRGLLWVNRVTLAISRPLPVYPDQQIFLVFVGISKTCQDQTWRLVARSFTDAGKPTPEQALQKNTRTLQLRLVGDLEAARALCIVMTTDELSELIRTAPKQSRASDDW
jgi:hypothetical protein